MMHLRSLSVLLLCLLGDARRSFRIDVSHQGAQRDDTTLANGLEMSSESGHALVPRELGTGLFRRAGPQVGALGDMSKPDDRSAGRLQSHRKVPLFGFTPGRAKVALQAQQDTEHRSAGVSLSKSRREALSRAATAALVAAAAAGGAAEPAFAKEEFSTMGGLLVPFVDTQKGYKLYTPSGWNKFDADPGVYDVKFQDIIEIETRVQVSSSPVVTATSVTALGELDEVAAKFAKPRSATVVAAKSRDVGGTLIYDFELKGEKLHELLSVCVNNGKLYLVSAVTSNNKWDKRKELYKNIILSFVPRGF